MYVDREVRDPINHRISAKKKQKNGPIQNDANNGVVGEVSSNHNPGGGNEQRGSD
jgi:hypothetical protein